MDERKGVRMAIVLKATIKENGATKVSYFNFPNKEESFDRPSNVFFNTIEWFRARFPHIDNTNLAIAILKHDDSEKERIMGYIVEGVRKKGGAKNGGRFAEH